MTHCGDPLKEAADKQRILKTDLDENCVFMSF